MSDNIFLTLSHFKWDINNNIFFVYCNVLSHKQSPACFFAEKHEQRERNGDDKYENRVTSGSELERYKLFSLRKQR